jgi:hypothetical protein
MYQKQYIINFLGGEEQKRERRKENEKKEQETVETQMA